MTNKIAHKIFRLDTFTAFMGLVMIAAVFYSLYLNTSVSHQYESLFHARDEFKSHVIMSHLWLEEALYGDNTVDLKNDVFGHLNDAESFYAQFENRVKKTEASSRLYASLGFKLDLLISQAKKRLKEYKAGEYDPESDRYYDGVFNEVILLTDKYSEFTQKQMEKTHKAIEEVNAFVILLLVISFISTTILVVRFRRLISMTNTALEDSLATNNAIITNAIITNAIDGIFSVDSSGVIESANKACEGIFGYLPEELIGKNISMLATEARHDNGGHITRYSLTDVNNVLGVRCELTGKKKDGSEVPIELAATEIPIGDEIKYTGIIRNISERKIRQQELIAAKEKAENSDRVKSEFLSCMSHELRTPMNGIIGILSILKEENLTSGQNSYIDIAYNSADTFVSLLNNILDFTRLETDRIVLEDIEFDIKKMTEDLTKSLSAIASEKGLKLSLLSSPKVPYTVIGDPTRIRQVITNIIGNAIKFTSEGEITVKINEQERSGNSSTILIEVIDTGIGIDKKDQERIFEMFTQADSSTTREFGGTGLGLSICKNLVNKMGGQIGITSDPDKGSNFWFTLDMERGHEPSNTPAIDHENHNIHLLFACDHKKNIELLQDLSTKCAGTSATVDGCNHTETIAELKSASESSNPFDLVIIDMLDFEKGLDLASAINSDNKLQQTKMIILTSGGKRGDAMKAQNKGILAYLTKPFMEKYLHECITTVTNANFSVKGSIITKHSLAENESSKRKKILIVEDDLMSQKVASGLLQGLGYRADIVNNGKEALDAINEQTYDMVLMDCQMPIIDGYEATKNIRTLETGTQQHTIIIAVTANAMKGDREKCLAAGMDDYLTKPVSKDELEKVLYHWFVGINEEDQKILTQN